MSRIIKKESQRTQYDELSILQTVLFQIIEPFRFMKLDELFRIG